MKFQAIVEIKQREGEREEEREWERGSSNVGEKQHNERAAAALGVISE